MIGHPLGHTLSPAMHEAAFRHYRLNAVYRAMPVAPEEWNVFLEQARALPLTGFNATLPHKGRLGAAPGFRAGDVLTQLTGAVNTVRCGPDGWLGYNTDGPGFLDDLAELGLSPRQRRVVLAGAGGSARAILFALHTENAAPVSVTVVNRSLDKARLLEADFEKARQAVKIPSTFSVQVAETPRAARRAMDEAQILVNATSLGLTAQDPPPVDLAWLRPDLDVYDLIYHRDTPLLRAARDLGAKSFGGLGMLVRQGARAFNLWFGLAPPVAEMRAAAEAGLNRLKQTF